MQALYESLDPTGMPFKAWWPKMAATCTKEQWQTKLYKLGTPTEQVGGADEVYIGKLLFNHIDFGGHYHEYPIQPLPLRI